MKQHFFDSIRTPLNAILPGLTHTQHRAHHSQTRVCARLVWLSYAQLGERREFGRRGSFGEVACCVLSGDHVCGGLAWMCWYGGGDRVFDLYLDVLLLLIAGDADGFY